MARTTIYDLSVKNLANMKVSELKSFIRKVSEKIARDRRSRFKAVSSSADYISNLLGIRKYKDKKGKRKVSLKLRFKGMRKNDLLKRARLLQGHLKIDVYSKEAKKYREKVTDEALESFERNTGISLSPEEFADYKELASGLKDIMEKYGSDNVAKMYDEVNQKGGTSGRLTLVSILREVYNNSPGADRRTLLEKAYEYINNIFDGIYDDTF